MLTSVAQRQRDVIRPYDGPCCPYCAAKLMADWIRTGVIVCPDCKKGFEATAFNPVTPKLRVAEVATSGPEGANACANHARNAAVTSCTRCGLFICSLCEMDLGDASYCPSCFDRMRTDGALPAAAGKMRDYYSMARIAVVAGIFFTFGFIGPLFGILALYYQSKGRKAMRLRGDDPWTPGAVIVMLLAIIVLVGSTIVDGFMIFSLLQVSTHK
jgi:ribosomal protein L37AE/L43A